MIFCSLFEIKLVVLGPGFHIAPPCDELSGLELNGWHGGWSPHSSPEDEPGRYADRVALAMHALLSASSLTNWRTAVSVAISPAYFIRISSSHIV